jgi:ectoine hydroxylase-related dioxygenase (phytanoyl-CoA dioxygenase family)
LEILVTRREQYQREGYLLGLPILSDSEVYHYRSVYERLDDEAARQTPRQRITNRHHDDPEMWNLATHPAVMAIVRELLGDDLVLLSSGFFAKKPGEPDAYVAWHQDTMYWGLQPPHALTVWIAIDDSDEENGCMRVIPRSHRLGLLPHRDADKAGNMLSRNQSIDPSYFDESTAVDFVLKAGQASVHHGELIHGSNANLSPRRRCGMTIRFTTPNVRPILEGPNRFTDRPILVSGKDHFGHLPYVARTAFMDSKYGAR